MIFKKYTLLVAFTGLATFFGTVSIASTQGFQDEQGSAASRASTGTLIGAWRTVVTPRDCLTGTPLGSLAGLLTFHEGGTMSEYGVSPGSSPALRSPGHGVWQRERGLDYSFAFIYYLYDASGVFIGSQKATSTLRLRADGRRFALNSVIEALDANDTRVGTGCATATGKRFE